MQFGKRTLSLLLALGLTTTSIPIALAADPGAAETPALAASANPEKTNSDSSQPEKAASKSESSQPVKAAPKSESSQPAKAAPKAESPKQASAPKQETPSVSSASSSADTDVPKKQDTQQESAPKQEDPQQTDPGSEKPQQEQPAQEDPVSEDPQQQDPQQQDPVGEDPEQETPDSEDPEQEDPDSEDPEQEESQQEEEDPDAEQPLSDEDIQDQEARDQEESQAEEPLSDEDMREQEARDQKQAQAQAGKDQKKRKRKIFTNPSDREIEKALEKYDSTIKDPEYEKAYTNYQEDLYQDDLILDEAVEEGTPELFSTNPFTDDSFVHTHPKTKYIYKGIDVSKWQGTIDWKAARAAGVRFAFVRCGYSPRESGAAFGTYMDERFAENVVNAADAGVKVGVYYYSTASSVAEAKKEAAYIVKLLNPYKKLITLPAIMDYETNKDDRVWDTYRRTTRATRTKFAAAFCQTLSDAGYQSGIYASRSWLNNFFDMSKLNKYHHWVAEWNHSTIYSGSYDFWQFASTGTVDGIRTRVDCDFWYTNEVTYNSRNLTDSVANGKATVKLAYTSTPFTGTAKSPAVSVTCNNTTLTPKTDYSVTYTSNRIPGTATVKVAGRGNYSGTVSRKFTITAPTAIYITTLKATYRSGAGTQYAKKGTIPKGTAVDVVYGWRKTVKGTNWYMVKVKGKYYYMAANYLAPQTLVRHTTKKKLAYRVGAGTRYKVKSSFRKGASVQIVRGWKKKANKVTWSKVKVGSRFYYTQGRFLTRQEVIAPYTVAKKVNLRAAAGRTKALRGKLLAGTPVSAVVGGTRFVNRTIYKNGKKVTEREKWFRVKVGTRYYYILSSFLRKK